MQSSLRGVPPGGTTWQSLAYASKNILHIIPLVSRLSLILEGKKILEEEKGMCTCTTCPNCGHLPKEQRGCNICKGGPEPGKTLHAFCPEHGYTKDGANWTPLIIILVMIIIAVIGSMIIWGLAILRAISP